MSGGLIVQGRAEAEVETTDDQARESEEHDGVDKGEPEADGPQHRREPVPGVPELAHRSRSR
jgi:hypothetical protein